MLLVPFPFSDLSTTKTRPAVVISSATYHRTEPDLVLAAVTSQVDRANGSCAYVLADWQAAGLRFPSALKPDIFTLEPSRVLHRVGSLSRSDLAHVDDRLRVALGL